MTNKLNLTYAVGYIRVSTEEQAADDRYGIDAQKKEILSYADSHGYTIAKWYVDHISGTSDDRPEWNKILNGDDVTNPPYEAVIAFKSDRIARDMKLYFYYLYVLEKRDIKMVSTQEEFEGESAFANVYRALLMFVAEQERKNIALRTGSGRKIKAAAGGFSGGRCPYGYTSSNGKLVIVPAEAKAVRLIFAFRRTNPDTGKPYKTVQEISDFLYDNGFRNRKGGRYLTSTICNIMAHSELYHGKYKYGKGITEYVDGQQEAILTDDNETPEMILNSED